MAWSPPTDDDIKPGDVVKASFHRRIRDLSEALANQDPGAPSITWSAMGVGGTQADGVLNDATTFSTSGWYEGSSLTLTGAKTIGTSTVIQVRGAADCSGQTLTVNNRSASAGDNYLYKYMNFEAAQDGTEDTGSPGDYGGAAGAWGSGDSQGSGSVRGIGRGSDNYINLLQNGNLAPGVPQVGGNSDGSGPSFGGGALLIAVDGNLDLSGCTITANATGGGSTGGGGGGSIYVLCRGACDVTGASFSANGGAGGGSSGGGGGLVYIVAETLTGTATISVTGSGNADDGLGLQTALTGARITMAMRLLNIGL